MFLLFVLGLFMGCKKDEQTSQDDIAAQDAAAENEGDAISENYYAFPEVLEKYVCTDDGGNLNFREKPVDGTKIGQFSNGTLLIITKRTDEKYTIDGITDYWYYAESKNESRGWVFGGYLAETKEEDVAETASEATGVDNIIGIPDGDYYVNAIKLQSVEYFHYSPKTEYNISIKVRGNKIAVYDMSANRELEFTLVADEYVKDMFMYSEYAYQKLPKSEQYIYLSRNDRYAGFNVSFLVYENNEVKLIRKTNDYEKTESYIYVFGKNKKTPKIEYDLPPDTFICNIEDIYKPKELKAYSTKDFSKEPDLIIPAVPKEYYIENKDPKEKCIPITNAFITNEGTFFEAEYMGKKIWFDEEDIKNSNSSVFYSERQLSDGIARSLQ